jgi:hypothetical protein
LLHTDLCMRGRKMTCSNLSNLSLYSIGIFLNIFLVCSILKVASLLQR